MEPQDFKSFFNEKLRAQGLTVKKLSEMSGIPLKYLTGLSEGDFLSLPAAPYLRGYLLNIGKILEFDGDEWWNELKTSEHVGSPGVRDALPENRFAARSVGRYIWAGILILAMGAYLITRLPHLTGRPKLTVSFPPESTIETKSENLVVRGAVLNGEEVLVNGGPAAVREGGEWEMPITLEAGLNTIEIKAKKFLGGETKVVRQIILSVPQPSPAATSTESAP